MSETSTYPLRLLKSLREEVTRVAKRDRTSVNQFIAIAVAEKISALETEQFFSDRAKAADIKAFRDTLFRIGGEAPRSDDEFVHR
ncbi:MULTISPECIES: toxin-antitoxin system HicB family antitoxin [Photorhabdus]|uniref:toxin-antitoxin system HicB family antitoxin n=1 Tax=Photorhabdus TaxID=29487 RepID=UPI0013F414E5|nr:toxin-antitoxin system HicB family antitoxin [Photorhabdus sp. RW14-46]NHB62092.1 toxin-antitoxin system HicB family antitoxin [Photorhabdus sp. RW14-46]